MTLRICGTFLKMALAIGLLLVAPGCDNSTNDSGNGPKTSGAAGAAGSGPQNQGDAYKAQLEASRKKSPAKDAGKEAPKEPVTPK